MRAHGETGTNVLLFEPFPAGSPIPGGLGIGGEARISALCFTVKDGSFGSADYDVDAVRVGLNYRFSR